MAFADSVCGQAFEPRIGRSVSLDHAAQMLGVSRRTSAVHRARQMRLIVESAQDRGS